MIGTNTDRRVGKTWLERGGEPTTRVGWNLDTGIDSGATARRRADTLTAQLPRAPQFGLSAVLFLG